ncbi:hypothetical protein M0R45_030974 [Rubus argutus]|uniref:Uncharacterized protein n=1 Tax=Rubus argutus TaxID=59490 RepID=A0AAW1WDD5_RUBAR
MSWLDSCDGSSGQRSWLGGLGGGDGEQVRHRLDENNGGDNVARRRRRWADAAMREEMAEKQRRAETGNGFGWLRFWVQTELNRERKIMVRMMFTVAGCLVKLQIWVEW